MFLRWWTSQKIEIKDKNDLKSSKSIYWINHKNHIGKICICFKTDRNDVTLSRELNKILNKILLKNQRLLFLTNNLTVDVQEILKKNGIEFMNVSNYIDRWKLYSIKKWKQNENFICL